VFSFLLLKFTGNKAPKHV